MDTFEERLATQPHDAFFKETFSDSGTATAFFCQYLPAALTTQLDWSSLRQVQGSFVTRALQQLHSDLLFSVKARDQECLLYVLFEHQTSVDTQMPLRMLNYASAVLLRHSDLHPGQPLPPVLPVLFHQGPNRWTVSPCFEDLFHIPGTLRDILLPYLPKFRHALVDLSQEDPKNTVRDSYLRMAMEAMKRARMQEAQDYLDWLKKQDISTEERLLKLLLYLFQADKTLDVEAVVLKVDGNPTLQEKIMSTAAALIAKGKAEGKAEGEATGKLRLLQKMMGVPVATDQDLAGLSAVEIDQRFEALEREYEAQFRGK